MKKERNKIITNLKKEVEKHVKREKLIEKICRAHCVDSGINPDALVCQMMPQYIQYPMQAAFYVPPKDFTVPAWSVYHDLVHETLKALGK